jgi:hypothetical protein
MFLLVLNGVYAAAEDGKLFGSGGLTPVPLLAAFAHLA